MSLFQIFCLVSVHLRPSKDLQLAGPEKYTNIIRKLKLLNDKSPGCHLKLYSKNDYILPKHHEILTVVNTVDYISNNHQETFTMVRVGLLSTPVQHLLYNLI